MNNTQLQKMLDGLISSWEDEVTEFKEVSKNFTSHRIGKYFSALANEANLRGEERAWLVFGVSDKTRSVVGTGYLQDPAKLQSLKQEINFSTQPRITFRNIHELETDGGRVVMMEIPAAPLGIPIAWKGHYYARAGESLTSLGMDKLDEMRNQTVLFDWSAHTVEDATVNDLDTKACNYARAAFAKKHPKFKLSTVKQWSLKTFLERAKVTRQGKITRTALLLLGKPQAAHYLLPHPAQITWKLEGQERDYEHFGTPFILATSDLFKKIRNTRIKFLPEGELLPHETSKYDEDIVLEALHNCIAHQDYTKNGRIVVVEHPFELTFQNDGKFYEGNWDDYLEGSQIPVHYRNPFLAQAMASLNMIDTLGFGIHGMFIKQRDRYLPLPDYKAINGGVQLTLHGQVIDIAYSRALMKNADLELQDVVALDRLQKGLAISKAATARLERALLIKKKPGGLQVSAKTPATGKQKAQRPTSRIPDDLVLQGIVEKFVMKRGRASRKEIDELLWGRLGDALGERQKKKKISNIISLLREKGAIFNAGSRIKSDWRPVGTGGETKKSQEKPRKAKKSPRKAQEKPRKAKKSQEKPKKSPRKARQGARKAQRKPQ